MNNVPRFAELLTRIFTNKSKDLFSVQLGAKVLLGKYGIGGIAAEIVGLPLRGVLGLLIEEKIFFIDTTADLIREGMKLKNFEKLATEAYHRASAKIHTEKEKEELRETYLEIIRGIGVVGNPSGVFNASEVGAGPER